MYVFDYSGRRVYDEFSFDWFSLALKNAVVTMLADQTGLNTHKCGYSSWQDTRDVRSTIDVCCDMSLGPFLQGLTPSTCVWPPVCIHQFGLLILET